MPVSREILDEVIEDLKGQCVHDLEHFLNGHGLSADDMAMEDNLYVDMNVFLCDECGWWCDADEMSDEDDVCDECHPDDDD